MPSRRVLSRQWLPFRRNICDALAANSALVLRLQRRGRPGFTPEFPVRRRFQQEIAGHQCTIHAAGYQVPSRPSIKFSPRAAQHADCSRFIDCIARRDPARRLTYNWRIISFRNSFTRSRCFYVWNRRLRRLSQRQRIPHARTAAAGIPRLRQLGHRHDHARGAIRPGQGRRPDRPAAVEPGQHGPPPGAIGIGHTRWATHGAATDETPIRTSAATTSWRSSTMA